MSAQIIRIFAALVIAIILIMLGMLIIYAFGWAATPGNRHGR